jgi:Protein of unknown function (DUF2442)
VAPRVRLVSFTKKSLRVGLSDGREVSVPLSWFPRLQHAPARARAKWRVIGAGSGIHWPEIDEDVSVASLLGLPSD